MENTKYAIYKFNWSNGFENISLDGTVKHLNKTLLNIFRNYIQIKKMKCDYRQTPWINENKENSLNQRSKLTKIFCKNWSLWKIDHIKVLEKSTVLRLKKNYILKMTTKLEGSHTASKTYLTILNRILYNSKMPTIPPLLVDGSFVSDYCKKANLLITFLLLDAHL